MNTRNQVILALALVLIALGAVAFSGLGSQPQEDTGGTEEHDHSAMSAGTDEAQPVSLDADAADRIGVTYAPVTRGALESTVQTVGFVSYDETRLTSVSPRIDGWVERLMVDFTGAPVRAGQPLMEVYSPALVTAQEELLLALELLEETRARGGTRAAEKARDLVDAARRRLAYWDISQEEIQAIEERATVVKTLTLRAPASGIVVEKDVVEGTRITPGMNLYRIADLSRVWVEAEVFEKDLSLIREGQHGMISFESYPGETFHGTVSYIYPTVSRSARTGRVRLEMANPNLRIKPGMYAQVELQGQPLEETLLVPRTAVLETGERSVVFHRMADGRLHPMEVVTGLSRGDQVQVLSGLSEGQVVAASATFLIDAESNLASAMAGMAGMDHSGMDMGGSGTEPEEMDHSQHETGGMGADTPGVEMDHSQHDMSDTVPDTAGTVDHSRMDHSGHIMPDSPPDTLSPPDTTAAGSHEDPGASREGRGS